MKSHLSEQILVGQELKLQHVTSADDTPNHDLAGLSLDPVD